MYGLLMVFFAGFHELQGQKAVPQNQIEDLILQYKKDIRGPIGISVGFVPMGVFVNLKTLALLK